MHIDRRIPEPRKGWRGKIDGLIGPGATAAEKALQIWIPLAAMGIVCGIGLYLGHEWTWVQYAVAAILAFDTVGGIATNLTSAAKRWNFRPGNGLKQHMLFAGLHVVQLTLLSYFFLDFDIVWIVLVYAYLMLSIAFILAWPLYLQRPVSGLVYAVSIVFCIYVFRSPEHLEWFLPLFFFKLQIGHIVREEPYRPS